jgi:uncharacterized protein (DUF58 family)
MRYVVLVLALVVMIYLVMDFNSRTAELTRLRAEREIVSTRLVSRTETRAALEAQIAYATSDAAVIEWAYQNHLARPGDNVVIPMQPAASTPVPTPKPTVVITEVSNLERWLTLFIDPAPKSSAP